MAETEYLPLGRSYENLIANIKFDAVLDDRAKRLYGYVRAAMAYMSPGNLSGVKNSLLDLYRHLHPDRDTRLLGPLGALSVWIDDTDEDRARRESVILMLLGKVRVMLEGEHGFR